ncbi:tyrosinase family protein [Granulicella mallensis]|uniref:Tyrosinase n=1 Tax=Granulicella mallensis TaxID=940614 RepID=A0A7W7ZLM5_9BACT|nr:tyrosinase family protein [Granulicella mallensis]MBB5062215.1 tyrosinase [Granulicella mallensis]
MSIYFETTRRDFLKTSLATAGTAALSRHLALAQAPAKYRRYSVTSQQGQKALVSYAKAIQAMLNLPADHPQNWFRNAFVHLMDCPHGNWWFYVWHRGYLGYFEQTIRTMSGDPNFAMPYWDWSDLAQIPDSMFNDVLTPVASAYERYTKDLQTFTAFIQPSLKNYWGKLSPAQIQQLNIRGYKTFDDMWNDVSGWTPTPMTGHLSHPGHFNPENTAFAPTPIARYLTLQNPQLSDSVKKNVSKGTVYSGLEPTNFATTYYQHIPIANPIKIGFNSSTTASHNTAPSKGTVFSTLEGLPHNSTHNYIGGGAGEGSPIPNGPWGNMTNNLSPVDPIFFLHHSNMDRLWDVWTRKQQALNLPYLPNSQQLPSYEKEPFLFYVDGNGKQVGPSIAKEYISMSRFGYDYEPGYGEEIIGKRNLVLAAKHPTASVEGLMKGNAATLTLSAAAIKTHLDSDTATSLFALVTVPRPTENSPNREFDVLVGAPADATNITADSPYYAGKVAFFCGMMHMSGMTDEATFIVPLPKRKEAFANLSAAAGNVAVTIRAVPSGGGASVLRAVTVQSL